MIRAAIAVVAVALPVGLVVARQGGPAPAPPSTTAAVIDGLRAELRADVAADNVGGITAAVVVGDRLAWAEGFGWADRDKHVPAGIETIYRIGSISKSFTAVVMCQLVDRKVIALDDAVERYLPEVRGFANSMAGAKPITFRQLASHTAGLIREPALPDAASGPIAGWEAKVLASIPKTSFDSMPGTKYSYSNIGYGVLGLALSRAANAPFMKLVEDGIFAPLGMTSSTYVIDDRLRPWLSVGYANSARGIDSDLPAREHLGRGYKVPNGGIYSTVVDMARYIGALSGASKAVMSDTMRQAMQTRQTPAPGPSGYGFGLEISATPGAATVVGHGGSVAGYVGQIAFDPVEGGRDRAAKLQQRAHKARRRRADRPCPRRGRAVSTEHGPAPKQEASMTSIVRIVRKIFVVGGWAPLLVFGIHGILSRVFHAYDVFPKTDIPMHFLGGVSMAFFISRCFQALPREIVRSSRIVVLELVLVGSLTATAAVLWEFAEFACDQAFGTNIQRGLQNTMQDLALGLTGALAVMIGRAWQLKARAEELRAVADEWIYGRAVLR